MSQPNRFQLAKNRKLRRFSPLFYIVYSRKKPHCCNVKITKFASLKKLLTRKQYFLHHRAKNLALFLVLVLLALASKTWSANLNSWLHVLYGVIRWTTGVGRWLLLAGAIIPSAGPTPPRSGTPVQLRSRCSRGKKQFDLRTLASPVRRTCCHTTFFGQPKVTLCALQHLQHAATSARNLEKAQMRMFWKLTSLRGSAEQCPFFALVAHHRLLSRRNALRWCHRCRGIIIIQQNLLWADWRESGGN